MENKSEYGIYEEFLKNFDSVNYKNKDSSIINNEFQKVIRTLHIYHIHSYFPSFQYLIVFFENTSVENA